MKPRAFCEFAVRLNQHPFSLADRPHFWAIYESAARNIVIRASRQCEKSTFLANRIIYDAIHSPGARILLVSPRQEQGELFSRDRLQPMILNSPLVCQVLWPHKQRSMPVTNIQFANGSRVYFRSAFRDANGVRGISATSLLLDEFQDIAHGELGVIQETIRHAPNACTVL